ncbi:GH116 family glycosyl hydrolase, partial [Candidatus Hydrogenedentota bacterium]
FSPLGMAWKRIQKGKCHKSPPVNGRSPGASIYVPFKLKPGKDKTIRLMLCWYVPETDIRTGRIEDEECCCSDGSGKYHVPWYASRFKDIHEVAAYWRENYEDLRERSLNFREAFYDTTLPDEVVEAVAANLTILKSPTVLRQADGRLWAWEGCSDAAGCCAGSCTHVWNYAQAVPHLFPELERGMREYELGISQNSDGHQTFRTPLPIREPRHKFHSAADGQLGRIMSVYREWRISGDTEWMKGLWPKVKTGLEYCIRTWDPDETGLVERPHHNTYDIEFWGPDGMCSSIYLGALAAASLMGGAAGEDVSRYEGILNNGKANIEERLYNGEYFFQEIVWEGVDSEFEGASNRGGAPEVNALLDEEGPKYQYGNGCLADGVLGLWMARMCGLGSLLDRNKVRSSLRAIYKYNLKRDLSEHANPARPTYALGDEGGLLLCTWPNNDEPTIPFSYSYEVWTGIEYQVASHMMLEGMVEEGLEIVRICRARYDGTVRNPFNEYECGHWYARALASYGLLQGLTGARYDAVERELYIDSRVGNNFRAFISTATGFGSVGLDGGQPYLRVVSGHIDVETVYVSGKKAEAFDIE